MFRVFNMRQTTNNVDFIWLLNWIYALIHHTHALMKNIVAVTFMTKFIKLLPYLHKSDVFNFHWERLFHSIYMDIRWQLLVQQFHEKKNTQKIKLFHLRWCELAEWMYQLVQLGLRMEILRYVQFIANIFEKKEYKKIFLTKYVRPNRIFQHFVQNKINSTNSIFFTIWINDSYFT